MNFAKYIIAHNLVNLNTSQTNYIFEFSSSQALKWYITYLLSVSLILVKIFKNGPKWTDFEKPQNQTILENLN